MQIGQFRAQFELALLRELKGLHQLFRFTVKELRVAHIQLPAAAEEFFKALLRRLDGAGGAERKARRVVVAVPLANLFGDSLGHAKNVSRMLVIILHQRLVRATAFLVITEPPRDFGLQVK